MLMDVHQIENSWLTKSVNGVLESFGQEKDSNLFRLALNNTAVKMAAGCLFWYRHFFSG